MSKQNKKSAKAVANESVLEKENKKVTSDKLTLQEAKTYLENGTSFRGMGRRRSITAQMSMLNVSSVLDCLPSENFTTVRSGRKTLDPVAKPKKKVVKPTSKIEEESERSLNLLDSLESGILRVEKITKPEKKSKKKLTKTTPADENDTKYNPKRLETTSVNNFDDYLNISDITVSEISETEKPKTGRDVLKVLNETFIKKVEDAGKKVQKNVEQTEMKMKNGENLNPVVIVDNFECRKRPIKGRKNK